jgi:hypothetical protein
MDRSETGFLHFNNEWLISVVGENTSYPLHSRSLEFLKTFEKIFDNLQARVAHNPVVTFTVVEENGEKKALIDLDENTDDR